MDKFFLRTDNSILSRWWWSVDRWSLLLIFLLISIGVFLIMAASPDVAEKIDLERFYFIKRHIAHIGMFLLILFLTSITSIDLLKKLSLLLFIGLFGLLIATLIGGNEIKGAKRWITIANISLQPSESLKPLLVVIVAWMLDAGKKDNKTPGHLFSIFFYSLVAVILFLQPDIGMLILISVTFAVQMFVYGFSIIWFIGCGVIGIIGGCIAYIFFPHVQQRIQMFLQTNVDNPFNERYQITNSLKSFAKGGLWGVGPGEGIIKKHLPDSHADFIFAVAGEEYGAIFCITIIVIFFIFIIRNLIYAIRQENLFKLLTITGIITQIALQAIINISSTLDLIPTKGMPLPFISFGGSAMISMALGCGIIIALTRKKVTGRI